MATEDEMIPINLSIPPDAHPGVLSGSSPNLVHAMTNAYKLWGSIMTAEAQLDERAKGERPKPPGRRLSASEKEMLQRDVNAFMKKTSEYKADLAKAAQPKIEAALTSLDKAIESAESQAAAIVNDIDRTLTPGPVDQPIHIEIRARLREGGKPPNLSTLSNAINSGDKQIIATVLGSHPMMLGIKQETYDVIKGLAVKKLCSEQQEKLETINKDIQRVKASRETFMERMGDNIRKWRSAEQEIIAEALGNV